MEYLNYMEAPVIADTPQRSNAWRRFRQGIRSGYGKLIFFIWYGMIDDFTEDALPTS